MIPIINVIGHSGSGKTYLIREAIFKLESQFNYDAAVFKYIHEHEIDKKGSDSFLYGKAGASYSITKNAFDETVIFLKKRVPIKELIDWIRKGPFKVDIVFTEGFRDLDAPTILCLTDLGELDEQLTKNVKMISGLITKKFSKKTLSKEIEIPIMDISKDFESFLSQFDID